MKFKVEIKICGINSCESAEASIGAEYIGFVFYQKSPSLKISPNIPFFLWTPH